MVRAGDGNVHQLATTLGVSISTIRRDLAALASRGRVTRTYGGAIDSREKSWRDKELTFSAEKEAIAKEAVNLIDPGNVVLLDAGSTVARLAYHLQDRTDLTVLTNGFSTLLVLADATVDVIVLGGRLRRPNESLLGVQTNREVERLTPDIAFLGADAVDPSRGLNCPVPEQASVKELMAARARHAWILADHSKVCQKPAFPYWALISGHIGVVTDAAATRVQRKTLADAGWEVRIAAT